jgi:hypothetical protein
MARLTILAEDRMAALDPEFGDAPVESLVHFGRLAAELRIEAENFGADLIGLATRPTDPGRVNSSAPGIWAARCPRWWSCYRWFQMTRPIGRARRWPCPPSGKACPVDSAGQYSRAAPEVA